MLIGPSTYNFADAAREAVAAQAAVPVAGAEAMVGTARDLIGDAQRRAAMAEAGRAFAARHRGATARTHDADRTLYSSIALIAARSSSVRLPAADLSLSCATRVSRRAFTSFWRVSKSWLWALSTSMLMRTPTS